MPPDENPIVVGANVRLRGIANPGMVVRKVNPGNYGVTPTAVCLRFEHGKLIEESFPLAMLEWVPPEPVPGKGA
jgi:hypothetical protein